MVHVLFALQSDMLGSVEKVLHGKIDWEIDVYSRNVKNSKKLCRALSTMGLQSAAAIYLQ